jgi:hypothetical protein
VKIVAGCLAVAVAAFPWLPLEVRHRDSSVGLAYLNLGGQEQEYFE